MKEEARARVLGVEIGKNNPFAQVEQVRQIPKGEVWEGGFVDFYHRQGSVHGENSPK